MLLIEYNWVRNPAIRNREDLIPGLEKLQMESYQCHFATSDYKETFETMKYLMCVCLRVKTELQLRDKRKECRSPTSVTAELTVNHYQPIPTNKTNKHT
jgi:hypothetical protein